LKELEPSINRIGSDYKDFDVDDPQQCPVECANEGLAICKAWTLVKPGVQGPRYHCWLKNDVPVASVDDCCASGLNKSLGCAEGTSYSYSRHKCLPIRQTG